MMTLLAEARVVAPVLQQRQQQRQRRLRWILQSLHLLSRSRQIDKIGQAVRYDS